MKKLLYTLLAVSIVFAACKKEDEAVAPTVINGCTDSNATNYNSTATSNDGSCTYSVIGTWNVVSMAYDITLGVYTSGSYPIGSYTVTNLTSGISNYALVNAQLTHQFSSDGIFTQIYNDDISNNQADTSYGSFVISEDSIFLSSGQKGSILVTENTLLMDLFHINLDQPDFESFQFNHASERE
jgi:hypothetical protein